MITIPQKQENVIYFKETPADIEARCFFGGTEFVSYYPINDEYTRDKAYETAISKCYNTLYMCNKVGLELFQAVTGEVQNEKSGQYSLFPENKHDVEYPVVRVIDFEE